MTEEQRRDDYERSCELANRIMRDCLIRAGQILPRQDDPHEQALHEEWRMTHGK